jgi:hypothetical protein
MPETRIGAEITKLLDEGIDVEDIIDALDLYVSLLESRLDDQICGCAARSQQSSP